MYDRSNHRNGHQAQIVIILGTVAVPFTPAQCEWVRWAHSGPPRQKEASGALTSVNPHGSSRKLKKIVHTI